MAQKQLKIFFDLDGTLIDVAPRHYRVYCEVTESFGGKPMDQQEYWSLKRDKTKWPALLTASGLPVDIEFEYLKKFISKIEDPRYLDMDQLYPGAIETLTKLSSAGECYLVSLRRNEQNLLGELSRLGLTKFFSEILSGHSENDGSDVKTAIIQKKLGDDRGVIIGDTEADILTGKSLGMRTVALTSGIRSESFLTALSPDYLVETIGDVASLVLG